MSWSFTDYWGRVRTLPVPPEKAVLKYGAQIKELVTPLGAIGISYGEQGRTLVLTGKLFQTGQLSSFIETQFVFFFRDSMHRKVIVNAPDTRYDASWVIRGFECNENKGIVNLFDYRLELYNASTVVVL